MSSTYQWSAGVVAGKVSKTPIYVLAEEKLKVYISFYYKMYTQDVIVVTCGECIILHTH